VAFLSAHPSPLSILPTHRARRLSTPPFHSIRSRLPLRVAPDARAHTKRRLTRRSRSLVRRLPRVRARLRRRLQAGASRVRSSPPSRLARNPPREARV
jgi:hypothetical protein